MSQIKLAHTKHLWAFTQGNSAIGTRCLIQCHGFRTVLGMQYNLPATMQAHFYVAGGYSLYHYVHDLQDQTTGAHLARFSMEMRHVMQGRVAPVKNIALGGPYTDYMLSKDSDLSYADLQYFLDNANNVNNWDIISVRDRKGTLYVNLEMVINKLDQNGYTDVHFFFCRSSLAHPSRDQLPGGYAVNAGTYPNADDDLL